MVKNDAFLKHRVEQGELGKKTGRGFYAHPVPRFTKPGFVEGRVKEEGK